MVDSLTAEKLHTTASHDLIVKDSNQDQNPDPTLKSANADATAHTDATTHADASTHTDAIPRADATTHTNTTSRDNSTPSASLCILRLSALGDCINAFGLIGGLKRTYPKLALTWVLDRRFAALFCDEQGNDLVPMVKLDFSHGALHAAQELKKTLATQAQTFDALLNMQTSIKASWCSLFIPATAKYGYDAQRSREGQRFFINHQVPSPENPHVLAGFMAFAETCGYPIAEPYWDFQLDPYILDKARCVMGHEKICALCPCSANESKNWTIPNYVELCLHAQNQGMEVVLLGNNKSNELTICQSIAEQCQAKSSHKILNLCGKTNLRELAGYLSVAKIVVAPDSGSMHLAAVLGTPVIGLFARHDEQRVGPWNFMDLNVSVYHKLAAQELKGHPIPWRYRVRQNEAMSQISVEQVINTFDRAIERYRI